MKAKLSQTLVNETLTQHQRIQIWDTQIASLYAEFRANGTGTYFVRYTDALGNKKTVSIGPLAVISVDDARKKGREILGKAYLGYDPVGQKHQLKTALTLAEVVERHYLPYIKVHKKSWDCDVSILNNHILPVLAQHKLMAIQVTDIAVIHQGMFNKGLAPATCNRMVVLLRFLFNLAIRLWKLPGITVNPASEVKLFKVNNLQQTFLDAKEINTLLKMTQACTSNPYLSFIIALLTLSGVRKRNVLDARWQDIDFINGTWRIPMTKSGKSQTIPLSAEMIQVLQHIPRPHHSEFLFPSPITGKPFKTIFCSWNTARKKAGLAHVRIHDLRHTFASLLINNGHSLYVVQKALGHYSPSVTMRYAHLADDTLRQANADVGSLMRTGISQIL